MILKLNEKKAGIEQINEVKYDFILKNKQIESSVENIEKQFVEDFSKMSSKIHNIDQKIESKVNSDVIFEINSKINKMCEKEEFLELEKKIFPMLNDVVKKISKYYSMVEEVKGSMLRFDEIIMDKASKLDVSNIQKRMNNCLEAEEFNDVIKKQDVINDVLNKRTKELILEFEKHENTINQHTESFDQINHDVDELMLKAKSVVTRKDVEEIREMLVNKVNR